MPMLKQTLCSLALLSTFAACDAKQTTTPEPTPAAAEPEPEPEPPPPTNFSVGTFNVEWFFDHMDDRSKLANEKNAASEEDWKWKLDAIATILKEQDLDVVALQSVGGEREVRELSVRLRDMDGPDYYYAIEETGDRTTSQHVAVLSRFPLYSPRRLDIKVGKHMVVDVATPDGEQITLVTAQLKTGNYKQQRKIRAKQAKSLREQVQAMREESRVLVLGDLGSKALPEEEGYRESAVALLSGQHNKDQADDCADSGEHYEAQETTVKGETRDRMLMCGLEAEEFRVVGEESIVRGEVDPTKAPWSSVALEERDVSDHFLLTSTISLPSVTAEKEEAALAAAQQAESGASGHPVAAN